MEKIRMDFSKVQELTNSITNCSNTLAEENAALQSAFKDLNKDFDDAYYYEYEAKFEEGNRVIKEMQETINDIVIAVITYATTMESSK